MRLLLPLLLATFACRDSIPDAKDAEPIGETDVPTTPDTDRVDTDPLDTDPPDPIETDLVDTDLVDTDPPGGDDTDPVDTDPIDTDPAAGDDTDPIDTSVIDPGPQDADLDGALADVDCDDADADVFPGATELCDAEDNDCDGFVDEDAPGAPVWYRDLDGDGRGDPAIPEAACTPPAGFVATATDCDDTVPTVYPGATELCDGLDNDCDLAVDEGAVGSGTFYRDTDGDGFGLLTDTLVTCTPPAGWSAAPGDCDDDDATIRPGAPEVCDGLDQDCDGAADDAAVDAPVWWLDVDGDGFGGLFASTQACAAPPRYVADWTDCDDLRDEAFPGADETCNDLDDDCDGTADEGAVDPATWYLDADRDGYGAAVTLACDAPPDHTSVSGDCDDADPAVYPGATTWHRDADSDGFGNPAVTRGDCLPPDGYVLDATDCDDALGTTFPGADETCNGRDDDCDRAVDEGAIDPGTWYRDADGDRYGDASTSAVACTAPVGFTDAAGDCDDTRRAVSPAATEVCNGLDDDCDGDVDTTAVDRRAWYPDGDGDGFGAGSPVSACAAPPAHSASARDCDDTRADVFPGAAEVCDGVDQGCDGLPDSPVPATAPTWYADGDGDGFGNPRVALQACAAPAGFVADRTDCDDGEALAFPGGVEVCNGVDDDCDGVADDGIAGATTWYRDVDGDGFGDDLVQTLACSPPGAGWVLVGGDCDDAALRVSPAATERCNGLDDDCDGDVDGTAIDRVLVYPDGDGDGFGEEGAGVLTCADATDVLVGGDCDDGDAGLAPDVPELCDGVDQDCDGTVDGPDPVGAPTWYLDADGDGYGNPAFPLAACSRPAGWVANPDDCDDLLARRFPGAAERCDGADDDCDGSVDEAGAIDAPTWYADADGDGFGDATAPTAACAAPPATVADRTDCDDARDDVNPAEPEQCDAVDHDCDGDPSDGTAGASPVCVATSCLDVLERGSPTGSGTFWLTGPRQEFCDFGTVGAGWSRRANLAVTASRALTRDWATFTLDIGGLVAAGQAQPRADDLRIFTLDGPLLRYWVDLAPGATVATVWVEIPSLAAGATQGLVATWGNPVTERKSLAWWLDRFSATLTTPYLTREAWSGTPVWSWRSDGTLGTDRTNADYLLELQDVAYELPIYVETRARTFDNDGVGVMLRRGNGGLFSAAITDDYQGVENSSGTDGMAIFDALPTAHYQGAFLTGSSSNLGSSLTSNRVGLYYDGVAATMYLNGTPVLDVDVDLDVVAAGLVSFANDGSPGATYDYLWVGSEPIPFNPETVTSGGAGVLGASAPF